MRAESLRFQHVRNHSETLIERLAPRINVLTGPNGAGKTSTLECLSLATLTKSFSSASDTVLISTGAECLRVEARFRSDVDVPNNVGVEVHAGPPAKKIITANSEKLRTPSELIGRAPVVVLTPDDKIITSGPPAERRRFLNVVLSQASRAYLDDEIAYKRALKQRNQILNFARTERRSLSFIKPTLEPWTEMLIAHGVRIMTRRARFIEEFRPYLLESFRVLSNERESPSLTYQPMGHESWTDFEGLLREEQSKVEIDELRRGTSLVGPHRDDVEIFIDPGRSAKHYASQGQHKTLLVSMKLAEFRYLNEASGETPILLLDDVFSELDKKRAAQLLELAEQGDFGQTFITSTEREFFERTLRLDDSAHAMFAVDSGVVERL